MANFDEAHPVEICQYRIESRPTDHLLGGYRQTGRALESELDHATGRLLTGFDQGLLETEMEEDQHCCLWAWSAEIDKTQTEYDFISINPDSSAASRCRSIWILTWSNGVAIRAGHGIILQKVWNSLVKDRQIIVME